MAGYEFVKNDAGNAVFVDILYPQRTQAGAYNVKILYEFNTETFARTLVGLFIFDDAAKAYVTNRGNNPFAKQERQFIANPYYRGIATPPATATVTPIASPVTPAETLQALKTAYDTHSYDRVIEIADAYLAQHTPTFDVLQYRYRTFFITKDFQKALQEIRRIESLGYVTNMLYCDAHVIALYAKQDALAQTYKTKAGAECKVAR